MIDFLLHFLLVSTTSIFLIISPAPSAATITITTTTNTESTSDLINDPQYQPPVLSGPLLHHHPGRKSLPEGDALEFLIAHNKVRAQYGEPPLKWSRRLARFAHRHGRNLVTSCSAVHSDGPHGENLFRSRKKYWSPQRIVESWAAEAEAYDAKNKNCNTGISQCGHFTQIVWRDTLKVGCQILPCVGEPGVIAVCNYDPPGNFINESPFDSIHNKHQMAVDAGDATGGDDQPQSSATAAAGESTCDTGGGGCSTSTGTNEDTTISMMASYSLHI
ncbi:hypothetical protein Dimus_034573 [Dionaea muscipula]